MATSKKAGLKDYIDTVSKFKPSAEVKFASVQPDGSKQEISASKTYWENMTSDEVQSLNEEVSEAVLTGKKTPSTGDLLAKIDAIAAEKTPEVVVENTAGKAIKETLSKIEEAVEQMNEDEVPANEPKLSPVAGQEAPAPMPTPEPEVKADVALILTALTALITKIDSMQNFTPVIHVPAPIIHVTMPEVKRTVTKVIERDEQGEMIKVVESIMEKPAGEPLIEVSGATEEIEPIQEAPVRAPRRERKKKGAAK